MRLAGVITVLLSGCSVSVTPRADTSISCRETVECPKDWVCGADERCHFGEYIETSTPSLSVAFSSPRQDESGAAPTQSVLLAFSDAIDEESLAARVLIETEAGALVASLQLDAKPLANTVTFAAVELEPLTNYILRVAKDIEGLTLLPLAEDVIIRFSTGLRPDVIAPNRVSSLRVDWLGATQATLSWTNPADADLAGVLILRAKDERVVAKPEARRSYAIGETIGNAEVIASIKAAPWVDITRDGGRYDYAFFAFDRENNYASPARAPFLLAETVDWCPDETGLFAVASPDSGSAALLLSSTPQVQDDVLRFPDTTLGTSVPLVPSAALPLHSHFFVRVRSENSDGVSLSLERELWIGPSAVVLNPPLGVGVGGVARVSFDREGWESVEAQLDVNPAQNTEDFVGDPVLFSGAVTGTIPSAGKYRFRVRPIRAGCAAPGSWTLSPELSVGSALYVSPSGNVANSGIDADHPKQTIAQALALANGVMETDIYVAAGDYPEQVQIPSRTRLLGSYDASFAETNRVVHPSRIVPDVSVAPLVDSSNAAFAVAMVGPFGSPLQGVQLQNFVVAPTGHFSKIEGVFVRNATASLIGNRIETITAPTSSCGVFVFESSAPVVQDNDIEGSGAIGLIMDTTVNVVVRNNRIAGHTGILLSAAAGELDGNVITQSPTSTSAVYAIDAEYGGPLDIHHNEIRPSATQAALTFGVYVSGGVGIHIRNNRIHGGNASDSAALAIRNDATAVIKNNLVFAGFGGTTREGLYCSHSNVTFTGNTVGMGPGGSGVVALSTESECHPRVINNLFFGSGAWRVLAESNPQADALAFMNNILLTGTGAPTDYLNDYGVAGSGDTLSASTANYCSKGYPVSGNVELALGPLDVFANAAGPDGNIATLQDNDWRLGPGAPTSITLGGVDASTNVCGSDAPVGVMGATGCFALSPGPCGSVVDDFFGMARSAPYSVGAIEADPVP